MKSTELRAALSRGDFDARFSRIYGTGALEAQKARYAKALSAFEELYGSDREVAFYSVAGRSELSGNHTDHNHGCVIAASIDLDIIAVAAPREDSVIRIKSEGFPEDVVDLNEFTAPKKERFERSDALIAGMAVLTPTPPPTCSKARAFPPRRRLRIWGATFSTTSITRARSVTWKLPNSRSMPRTSFSASPAG